MVEALAISGEHLFMPSIVLGELIHGFMKGSRRDLNDEKLLQIVDQLKMENITIDQHVARKYGIIYSSLSKRGKKIPINDVWIAACCMEIGGTLLTRDKHFEFIDQIETIILNFATTNLSIPFDRPRVVWRDRNRMCNVTGIVNVWISPLPPPT